MTNVSNNFNKLLIFRNLLNDALVNQLQSLQMLGAAECDEYDLAAKLIAWAEENKVSGNIAENYLLCQIAADENIFSTAIGKNAGLPACSLEKAAIHDIAILKAAMKNDVMQQFSDDLKTVISDYHPIKESLGIKPGKFRELDVLRDVFLDLSRNYSPQEVVRALCQYYDRYGCGRLAGYGAFKWDLEKRELVGIEYTDPVELSDIIGYEYQKTELVRNTEAFINGRPANNVLLVGARGTGKSSSVKAVANCYYEQGLRLIEIAKADFTYIPEIMSTLRQWGKNFILFIDDLSFEESEVEYKILKSLIDGGMEVRPDNVLIYATSNRRNLVKETWDDRSGNELHRQDTINEKISLADRFGITLFYTLPNQEEYLEIVKKIAKKSGIPLSSDELKAGALRWEMTHSGRSGRTAKQFIDYLAGEFED